MCVHMSADKETVQTYSSEVEAVLARQTLARHEIEATVHRFSRYRAMSGGGFLLKAAPEEMDRAQRILKKLEGDVDLDEYVDENDTSYSRCPTCGSVNIVTGPLRAGQRIIAMLTLGTALMFMKRDRTCKKCQAQWFG